MKAGIDLETTSLDPADGQISLVQVADPAEGIHIWDVLAGYEPRIPEDAVAHNTVFEERWLREKGYGRYEFDDTMIASLVFYTGTNAARGKLSHSLAAVVNRELKVDMPKEEQASDWSARPLSEAQIEYAARD